MRQPLPLRFCFRDRSANRVACSNTSRTPSPVLAEHSRYLVAPILDATCSPWLNRTRVSVRACRPDQSRTTHLLPRHRSLARPPQLVDRLRVVPQILLAPNEQDREPAAEVQHLRDPLLLRIQRRCGLAVVRTVAYASGGAGTVREAAGCGTRTGRARVGGGELAWTLSSESGESTAKQMRMTCESGYDKGRSRS